jgi:hypothetical protein
LRLPAPGVCGAGGRNGGLVRFERGALGLVGDCNERGMAGSCDAQGLARPILDTVCNFPKTRVFFEARGIF